eukprot:snap_masked-scaffold_9-processed-gene-12.22-mRNA-1 protein AED:1.00 eAED:1.00 QI:0/-1/0/0/-1/1/1/0/304
MRRNYEEGSPPPKSEARSVISALAMGNRKEFTSSVATTGSTRTHAYNAEERFPAFLPARESALISNETAKDTKNHYNNTEAGKILTENNFATPLDPKNPGQVAPAVPNVRVEDESWLKKRWPVLLGLGLALIVLIVIASGGDDEDDDDIELDNSLLEQFELDCEDETGNVALCVNGIEFLTCRNGVFDDDECDEEEDEICIVNGDIVNINNVCISDEDDDDEEDDEDEDDDSIVSQTDVFDEFRLNCASENGAVGLCVDGINYLSCEEGEFEVDDCDEDEGEECIVTGIVVDLDSICGEDDDDD